VFEYLCVLTPTGNESVAPQSYSDGKLEVVALYSSFHIAQLQVGLSQPHRVGQASCVQVGFHLTCRIQSCIKCVLVTTWR